MSGIDFSVSMSHLVAFFLAALFPVLLFGVTRWRTLNGRNGLQFLVAAVLSAILWAAVVIAAPSARPDSLSGAWLPAMTLAGALIFYLEIWALLSRGYTLGILLTLLKAGRPLTAEEIAEAYRAGNGLTWIMDHRLSGLVAARLIVDSDGTLTLTWPGRAIAKAYLVSIRILGLRSTG